MTIICKSCRQECRQEDNTFRCACKIAIVYPEHSQVWLRSLAPNEYVVIEDDNQTLVSKPYEETGNLESTRINAFKEAKRNQNEDI